MPPDLAVTDALGELGPPDTIAQAFTTELATVQARRVLFGFLITGPLVGFLWLFLLAPSLWPIRPETLWADIPVIPLVGIAVIAAVAVLATTGSFIRWLPEATPRRALTATTWVALGCVIVDLSVLATFAMRARDPDWQFPPPVAVTAVAASLVRILASTWALLYCRRTLRQLHW